MTEAEAIPAPPRDDSGLIAYATVLALHRIAVDPAQLRHGLGHDRPVDADDLKRIAKRQDEVRAKAIRTTYEKLAQTPLPALANGPAGWFVIAKIGDDEALIQPPCPSTEGVQPQVMKVTRDALEAMWSGELVLLTTREGIGGVTRAFDVSWFIPQLVKYRRLIGEVLLARFFGGIIGFDREQANKLAGLRTHTLVAGAAALLVGVSSVMLEQVAPQAAMVRSDPVRVIEAIITGISFIGAGTILRRNRADQVEGLTTAASSSSIFMPQTTSILVAITFFPNLESLSQVDEEKLTSSILKFEAEQQNADREKGAGKERDL